MLWRWLSRAEEEKREGSGGGGHGRCSSAILRHQQEPRGWVQSKKNWSQGVRRSGQVFLSRQKRGIEGFSGLWGYYVGYFLGVFFFKVHILTADRWKSGSLFDRLTVLPDGRSYFSFIKTKQKGGKIQCAEMLKVEKMLQFINYIKSGFNVSVPHERKEFVIMNCSWTIENK